MIAFISGRHMSLTGYTYYFLITSWKLQYFPSEKNFNFNVCDFNECKPSSLQSATLSNDASFQLQFSVFNQMQHFFHRCHIWFFVCLMGHGGLSQKSRKRENKQNIVLDFAQPNDAAPNTYKLLKICLIFCMFGSCMATFTVSIHCSCSEWQRMNTFLNSVQAPSAHMDYVSLKYRWRRTR